MSEPKPLKKVIPEKLQKFSTYAEKHNLTRQRIYQLAKENKLTVVEIDGVKFVELG